MIEPMPRLGVKDHPDKWKTIYTVKEAELRLKKILRGRAAILIGEMSGNFHAVAYDGEQVFDPNGKCYPLDLFPMREAWIVTSLQNN